MQDVWIFDLGQVWNFSWNAIRSTRFINIERWYYFVNFFFICSGCYGKVIVFCWQKTSKGFVWKLDFWLNSLNNSCEKVIESICYCGWVIDVFLSFLIIDGVTLLLCFIDNIDLISIHVFLISLMSSFKNLVKNFSFPLLRSLDKRFM